MKQNSARTTWCFTMLASRGDVMTKTEWLKCANPEPMLAFLRGKASYRKLHLFACACFRRIWHLLSDKRSRKAVEVLEHSAEGLATPEAPTAARASAVGAAADAGNAVSVADALYSEDRSTTDAYSAADAAWSAAEAPCFLFNADPRIAIALFHAACAAGCEAEAVAYAAGKD